MKIMYFRKLNINVVLTIVFIWRAKWLSVFYPASVSLFVDILEVLLGINIVCKVSNPMQDNNLHGCIGLSAWRSCVRAYGIPVECVLGATGKSVRKREMSRETRNRSSSLKINLTAEIN